MCYIFYRFIGFEFIFFADCKIGDDCIDFASLMYLFNIKSSKEVICLFGIWDCSIQFISLCYDLTYENISNDAL